MSNMSWDWSQINWAAEAVRFISTLGGVGIGAYIAYQFAARGRREDLFLKERYRAAENVIGLLLKLEDLIETVKIGAIGGFSTGAEGKARLEHFHADRRKRIAEDFLKGIAEIHESRKNTLFLSRSINAELNDVRSELYRIYTGIINTIEDIEREKEFYRVGPGFPEVQKAANAVKLRIRGLIIHILQDQKLPGLPLENEPPSGS